MSYKAKAKSIVGNMNVTSCPECGTTMCEVYRSNEDTGVFIWYECGKEGCCGQWLQKHPFVQKQSQQPLHTVSMRL